MGNPFEEAGVFCGGKISTTLCNVQLEAQFVAGRREEQRREEQRTGPDRRQGCGK